MEDSYYGDGYDMVRGSTGQFWCCGYKYDSGNYLVVISETEDSGDNWTRHILSSGTVYGYIRALAVDPSDSERVLGLGYSNSAYTLFYTEDGGSSWQNAPASGYTGTPYALEVRPGYPDHLAAGSSGGLYQSTNGGSTWAKITSPFTTVYDLYHSDLAGGLVICANNGVWLWNDWSGTPVEFGEGLPGVAAACYTESPDGSSYAGTTGAAVWRSYNGVGMAEGSTAPAIGYALSVQPNPVRGTVASASFQVASGQTGELSVYDLTGRRVLSAGTGLGAGDHLLSLDLTGLAPGVYFARLTTGATCQSAKMVITGD